MFISEDDILLIQKLIDETLYNPKYHSISNELRLKLNAFKKAQDNQENNKLNVYSTKDIKQIERLIIGFMQDHINDKNTNIDLEELTYVLDEYSFSDKAKEFIEENILKILSPDLKFEMPQKLDIPRKNRLSKISKNDISIDMPKINNMILNSQNINKTLLNMPVIKDHNNRKKYKLKLSLIKHSLEYPVKEISNHITLNYDIQNIFINMPIITKLSSNKISVKEIDYSFIKYPHVSKRRKTWKGKPNYRTKELDIPKSKGYAKRSLYVKAPTIDKYNFKKKKERLKRSLGHITLFSGLKLSKIDTVEDNFKDSLFDSYVQYGKHIIQEEMYTDSMMDSWETYMSETLFLDFLKDNFQPNIIAFSELKTAVKEFIGNEWDKYSKEAMKYREERYGMLLSNDDIDNLQSADLSYL